ncbi:MAG: agmatine deiminase family protein [Prevotella sp.]|nr:agmatine deiminase family protein [Prevotella sp.]
MPAEWERQESVQLTWPNEETDWAPIINQITTVYKRMAEEISQRERLIIVGNDIPHNDTWARDHGLITVYDSSPEVTGCEDCTASVLLDFKFNGWGEKFPAALDTAINRQLYDKGYVHGIYEAHLDFVLEGGSIESDGRGTIFTTECCLLAPHRNQSLTKDEIETRLKKWLGAERIVWLQNGSLIGDDTDGHIDTLMRVAPDDTLLYIGSDDDHPGLKLMEQELQALRTQEGQPYRLLRLPLPRPIYDEQGERLPATYANYLVINGAVLVPTYAQPDLDAEAMDIIGQAFPDREIIGIDCRAVIQQHGSLHCCTMQYY